MQGSKCYQPQIFYQVSLEQLVPEDHLVRQLARVLDLGWVRQATCACYSYTGRPSIDPVVIAKMFVLGFLYNIGSERQLMRDIQVNLAYRWYLGYDLDEAITDPDATLFRRPGGSVLGYKAHVGADAESGVITAVSVTTGSVDDTSAVPQIIEQHCENIGEPATVTADGQYGSQQCLEYLQQRGIETVIKQRSGGNKHGKLAKEAFTYEADADVYVCPCGNTMKRFRTDSRSRKAYYRCEESLCRLCQCSGQCLGANASTRVVTRYDTPYADRARQACASFRGRRLLRLRQTCIEGLFGQAKSLHGMARARWRGLAKVLMQVLLTATVLNIKKLLTAVTRQTKGAVAAAKSTNFLCVAFIIDVFVSAEYMLSIRRVRGDIMFFEDNQTARALYC